MSKFVWRHLWMPPKVNHWESFGFYKGVFCLFFIQIAHLYFTLDCSSCTIKKFQQFLCFSDFFSLILSSIVCLWSVFVPKVLSIFALMFVFYPHKKYNKNEGSHSSLYLFLSIYTSVNVNPWYDYVEYIVAERNECFMVVFLSEEWITIDRTPGLLSPEKRKKHINQ